MMKKFITLLAIALANQQPSVAQPIPSGKYVDHVGSEDDWVMVVDGRISMHSCMRNCDFVSQFQILKFNSSVPAILVKDHRNGKWSMCLESTAPSWANMHRHAYCDIDKGWMELDEWLKKNRTKIN